MASTQSIDSLNPFLAILALSTRLGRLMDDVASTYDLILRDPGCPHRQRQLRGELRIGNRPDERAVVIRTVVLYYRDALEAYRSDRFAPFQVQPEPGGVITGQDGYWGFYSTRPLPGTAQQGPATGMAVGAGIGGLVVLGTVVAMLVSRRRRARIDERE